MNTDEELPFGVGDRVRVVFPSGSSFYGYEGPIVGLSKPRRNRIQEYAVQFPDHPWQKKSPESKWFFSARELEKI